MPGIKKGWGQGQGVAAGAAAGGHLSKVHAKRRVRAHAHDLGRVRDEHLLERQEAGRHEVVALLRAAAPVVAGVRPPVEDIEERAVQATPVHNRADDGLHVVVAHGGLSQVELPILCPLPVAAIAIAVDHALRLRRESPRREGRVVEDALVLGVVLLRRQGFEVTEDGEVAPRAAALRLERRALLLQRRLHRRQEALPLRVAPVAVKRAVAAVRRASVGARRVQAPNEHTREVRLEVSNLGRCHEARCRPREGEGRERVEGVGPRQRRRGRRGGRGAGRGRERRRREQRRREERCQCPSGVGAACPRLRARLQHRCVYQGESAMRVR